MAEEDFSVAVSGAIVPEESVLIEKVRQALAKGTKKVTVINGYVVPTDSNVRLLTGPVVGDVTENSAVVLLEVDGPDKHISVSCALYKKGETDTPVSTQETLATRSRPFVFVFSDLTPNTRYEGVVGGVSKYNATTRMLSFRTKKRAEDIKNFRLMALTCDRPSRLLMGQQNPWQHMLRRIDDVDVVVHIGDQIYPDNEDIAHADSIFNDIFDTLGEERQKAMMLRGRELWRNKYRTVFSREGKLEVMSKTSNLMIWSDNDVANDFTTMKNADGSQKYHGHFLQCGMRTYREYQRRLWDPECQPTLPEETKEWHMHKYGPIGIFLFDLRGNRISGAGVQDSERPLLSDEQWADVEAFFADDDMRVAVLCSETPFLGDEPKDAKSKVASGPSFDFLRDHWPYNEDELIRLLDMCFAFKKKGEDEGVAREVLLLGGDIHCGVTSVVRDEETGLQIDHLTTSPITNHVCKFFPPPQGNISGRYNFSHLPLGIKFRNYADVFVRVDGPDVNVQAKLVPISTDIFKDATSWRHEDSLLDDDED